MLHGGLAVRYGFLPESLELRQLLIGQLESVP
jgi:hypothetical protein